MKREKGAEIEWIHFPLHPEIPPEGCTLEELFGATRVRYFETMRRRLIDLLDEEGLPHGRMDRAVNSRRAQELAKWAEQKPNGERIHDVLFRLYFVEDQNLYDLDVLVEAARSIGLDPDEARHTILDGTMEFAVDADWSRAREMGVTGVPTFLFGRVPVVGAQPYQTLAMAYDRYGAD